MAAIKGFDDRCLALNWTDETFEKGGIFDRHPLCYRYYLSTLCPFPGKIP